MVGTWRGEVLNEDKRAESEFTVSFEGTGKLKQSIRYSPLDGGAPYDAVSEAEWECSEGVYEVYFTNNGIRRNQPSHRYQIIEINDYYARLALMRSNWIIMNAKKPTIVMIRTR